MKKILFFITILFFLISCKKFEAEYDKGIKIISLTPSITKIIYELGAGNYVVGVSDYCEYKGVIKKSVKSDKVIRVAGFNSFNFENITALAPTHIFGMDSVSIENKNMLDSLIGKNKIYWFYHPRDFEGIIGQIIEIARILNKEEKAISIVDNINKRLTIIKNKIKGKKDKPKILVEIFYPPFMTVGKNTFISDIIKKAGGELAIETKENWPSISMEDLIAADPDVIIKTHLSNINDNLKLISAYKENRIFFPKNVDCFLQPGIESIKAVEELYEYLYGE